ncbi:3' exoribonuclease [Pleurostoma richardsiae]|uniref:Ribosomal RNA-processing protein 43 n=1 Tax=Pleurostoma richardsiae TaxID=41990 RepID=A0AA38RNQ3_9PEZI|nr:3' exoribonuclease [Pleurostoma richardsiae]
MASSLTFARSTFAKLSPHPFLLANLQPSDPEVPSSRTNGRAPHQARPPNINTSSLSHAHGSAVVRTGDTTVICGVRGEILPVANIPQYRPRSKLDLSTPQDVKRESLRELKDYDLLVPNIELATGCAPQFLPGVPPTTLAQTLSTRVYSLLHSSRMIDTDHLRIWYTPPKIQEGDDERMQEVEQEEYDEEETQPELKAYWTLYIDVLFISFDGNPLDAAWAAIVAALRDTKLPQARWDPDREMVVCSSSEKKALTVAGLPVSSTAAVFTEKEHVKTADGKYWILLDPDRLEESLCRETVSLIVDRSDGETRIRSISKSGGTIIGPELMKQLGSLAEQRWEDFKNALA